MSSNGANGGAPVAEMTPEMLREASDGLFMAAEHGRADVIKALIDHGQDKLDLSQVTHPDTGETPLHVAVHYRKTDAVRALLAAGFPPQIEAKDEQVANNPTTRTSMSPKPVKKQTKRRKRTAYLLAKEMQMEEIIQVFHQFIVQQVATNDLNAVKDMLEAGVEMNMSDGPHFENTLFHWAASCGATQVLEFLLAIPDTSKYDLINKQNKDGATPLHEACHGGQLACVKLLLAYDANRTILGKKRYSEGKTAFQVATKQEIKELFSDVSSEKNKKTEPKQKTKKLSSSQSQKDEADQEEKEEGENTTVQALKAHYETQLEEKDLLINQLKASIETLVLETQEIQKLGDEKVVLGYIRKLREEKDVIQEQLVDAEEYIRMQQEQTNQLKNQIRESTQTIEDLRTQVEVLTAEKAAKTVELVKRTEIQSSFGSNSKNLDIRNQQGSEPRVLAVTPLLVYRSNSHTGENSDSNNNDNSRSSNSSSSSSSSSGTSSRSSFWMNVLNLLWPIELEIDQEKEQEQEKTYKTIEKEEEAIMTV